MNMVLIASSDGTNMPFLNSLSLSAMPASTTLASKVRTNCSVSPFSSTFIVCFCGLSVLYLLCSGGNPTRSTVSLSPSLMLRTPGDPAGFLPPVLFCFGGANSSASRLICEYVVGSHLTCESFGNEFG